MNNKLGTKEFEEYQQPKKENKTMKEKTKKKVMNSTKRKLRKLKRQ